MAQSAGDSVRIWTIQEVWSQNKTQWAHWSKYAKHRKDWQAHIRVHLAPRRSPPPGICHCCITSYRKRRLDHGNLVGGCKPIPDVLKDLGWIVDDDEDHFKGTYQQVIRSHDLGTEILLAWAFPDGSRVDLATSGL